MENLRPAHSRRNLEHAGLLKADAQLVVKVQCCRYPNSSCRESHSSLNPEPYILVACNPYKATYIYIYIHIHADSMPLPMQRCVSLRGCGLAHRFLSMPPWRSAGHDPLDGVQGFGLRVFNVWSGQCPLTVTGTMADNGSQNNH